MLFPIILLYDIRGGDIMGFDQYQELIRSKYYDTAIPKMIELLEKSYGEFKLFYPRNAVNDKSDELYFFYDSKIVEVKFNENYSAFNLIVLNSDFTKKELSYSEEYNLPTNLTVQLKTGEELIFNNTEDSNKHWNEKYKKLILELFTVI